MSEHNTVQRVPQWLTGEVADVSINIIIGGDVASPVGFEDVARECRCGNIGTNSLIRFTQEDEVDLLGKEGRVN